METTFLALLEKLSPILAILLLGGAWVVRDLVAARAELQKQIADHLAEIRRLNDARISERDRDREVLRDVAGVLERVHVDVRDHDGRMTIAMRDNLDQMRSHVSDQVARLSSP
ncbi:MAG: hypothetical protein CMM84_16190 [Rhodothermaceae bacterium]|nr:hypothetical protein [Rhodothermaceae bacterium]MBC12515.1 hypothetical protein [Rhodothermaceae bacterium]